MELKAILDNFVRDYYKYINTEVLLHKVNISLSNDNLLLKQRIKELEGKLHDNEKENMKLKELLDIKGSSSSGEDRIRKSDDVGL